MKATHFLKNKKVIFIVLVAIVVAGFFGFWYYRDQIFSKEILKLEILGPEQATMGDEIQYTVKYKNNGNFVLQQPKLTFELPDNSLTEDSKTQFEQDLPDIYPGQENTVTFKTRLLGKEGDLEVAKAWLSYVPKNLSARYESDTTLTTTITTVPITLTFDLPSTVEKGKEITYAINYFSNIDYPLENLSIKVDPVAGFQLESADPTSLDNVEWKLDALQKAQGGRISIKGLVNADTGSNLTFLAHLGMWVNGTFVVIKEVNQTVQVIQPQLFISQQINNSASYTASPGESLHYDISFRNIGATPFNNVFAIVRLNGSAFDFSTLKSDQGQARPNDNLIVFDPNQVINLQHIDPQQEVKVGFDIKLKNSWTPADSEKNNTMIKSNIDVSDISQEFDTKVNTNLELSQKVYYAPQNGIQNSGPTPPQVNTPTTYTVVWQVKNDFNDVKNVKVKAVLPAGVTLTAKISPDSEISHFSLDSNSREIVWSPGDLTAGASLPALSFQISLTPSLLMQGTAPQLIGQATVSGDDQFTGATVQTTAPAVTTALPDDSSNSGGGIVK
jgi:uncharacterized repeat protein (TIGR01451 family)